MNFNVDDRTILLAKHGSHAYGTATATSDLDLKGVCIPPKDYFLGYLYNFEQSEMMANKGHEFDKVIYNITKFFKLAADCNPNIIEVLHVSDEDIIKIDKFGEEIRELGPKFVSKKAKHSFSGYARSQLKRIQTHKRWLLTPPTHKPIRKEFELEENTKLSQSEIGAFDALIKKEINISENALHTLNKERAYMNAVREWEQYENWKKTRNPNRAILEEKYGYDVKHGSHLIRLMRMCEEILQGKGVIVKRPDKDELLSIRNGGWSYERIIEEADKIEKRCDELYVTSQLQNTPDVNYLNAQCISIVERYINLS